MSKKHEAFGRLGDCSLAEFAELIRKRAFLDSLVKRAPAFSNFATGITVNVPLSPDPSAPTPEISPGLGPIGQFVFNFLLRWQLDQHVRQLSNGAGVSAEELPWVAMPVKRKIGYLKNEWQAADKLFGDGHQTAYDKEAKYTYGLLREAWERALEEVLLGGIIERFRPGIQTQHIGTIADITTEDCRTVDAAMTKCSKWLPGHDQAARAPVPEPAELKSDIDALENWVAAIRNRRR